MRTFLFVPAALLYMAVQAGATEIPEPAPLGKSATRAYRQVMPDGRVVYSDKRVKGAKTTGTITVEPSGTRHAVNVDATREPAAKLCPVPVPIDRVTAIPAPGKRHTLEDAQSDVIYAETVLEDARRRQQAGVEPLPGERTGNVNGTSRLNRDYWARQEALAQDVRKARERLRKAEAERNRLRPVR